MPDENPEDDIVHNLLTQEVFEVSREIVESMDGPKRTLLSRVFFPPAGTDSARLSKARTGGGMPIRQAIAGSGIQAQKGIALFHEALDDLRQELARRGYIDENVR
jgi:hypothetical protein